MEISLQQECKIYFAIINGRILVKVSDDARTVKKWLADLGYRKSACGRAIYGYMSNDRIQFYFGNDSYVPNLNNQYLAGLCCWYSSYFRTTPEKIYNGVDEVVDRSFTSCIPPEVVEVRKIA